MIKFVTVACFVALALGGTIPGINDKFQGHIVGGKATNINEVPYTVALLVNDQFFCGGTIVRPTVIVTAGHCLLNKEPRKISVRVGSTKSGSGGKVAKAKEIHIHPEYSRSTSENDVAVIVLKEPLTFSESVQPVSLDAEEPRESEPVKVSGYGLLSETGGMPGTLQSVVVPVVDRNICAGNYAKYRTVTDRMLCAGIGGKDSCKGDSGGPLVRENKLTGIVSFGVGCGRENLPGVYARVSHPEIAAFLKKHMDE